MISMNLPCIDKFGLNCSLVSLEEWSKGAFDQLSLAMIVNND